MSSRIYFNENDALWMVNLYLYSSKDAEMRKSLRLFDAQKVDPRFNI